MKIYVDTNVVISTYKANRLKVKETAKIYAISPKELINLLVP